MQLKQMIIREIIPHLKLKDANISWSKRLYVYFSIVIQLWVILIVCLYFLLPYIAKSSYHYNGVSFYLHNKVNEINANRYFEKTKDDIVKNSLYDQNENIEIHLLNDSAIYTMLNPIELLPNRQTFAVAQGSKVFLRKTDILNNKAYASSNANENLDAILVHEAVHVMQNNKYGLMYMSFKMPYWVKEGYAIYSARALSKYKEKVIVEYIKKSNDTDISKWNIFAQDQFYGFMVKHAIEKMLKSVDDLHLGRVTYDEVIDSLFSEYKFTKK